MLTIAQWITVARDVFVVAALGWILFYIHRAEQNAVKVADMQAVQKQLSDNVAQEAKWEQQRENAEAQQTVDMQAVATAVAQQHSPVIVRVPAGPSPVPRDPGSPAGGTAGAGSTQPGPGASIDVRPALNAFELKYEAYLAECRSILKEWPQ